MISNRLRSVAAKAAPSDPTVRELLARPDAEETFERIAGALPADFREIELTVVLTALAVLRGRQAAERVGKRLADAALCGEVKAW